VARKKNVAWEEYETDLLTRIYPLLGNKTKKAFAALGLNRSCVSINHKAGRVGVEYKGPAAGQVQLSEDEKHAVAKALGTTIESPRLEVVEQTDEQIIAAVDRIRKSVEKLPSPKPAKPEKPADHAACLVLSDIHYGAVVRDFDGNVTYKPAMTEQRIESIASQVIAEYPPEDHGKAVVLMVGDMVDGEVIYEHQPHEIGLCMYDQMIDLHRCMWTLIKRLEQAYGVVDVLCVPGNHGRLGKAHSTRSNMDRVLYGILQIISSMEKASAINVRQSYDAVGCWEVLGRKILMRHIAVPQDGTPARRNKLNVWHRVHGHDLLVCGHFHKCGLLDELGTPVIRNGTMKPPGEYAESGGYWGPARQAMFRLNRSGPVLSRFGWIEWSNEDA
jgi:hypothetical protein